MFDKRLLFFTGKGGVGKTTVAAATAVAASERGLRVLLVEVGVSQNLEQIFRKWIPVYETTRIEEGLCVIRLDPYRCLREYFALSLKSDWVARKFLEADVMHYLFQVMPGWRELMVLGKIWKMNKESAKGGGPGCPAWDMIVVDAPATGHGLSFLRVPQVVLNTLHSGVIRKQSQEVFSLITDPEKTEINVVSLPEEMPVNEAVEVYEATRGSLGMSFGRVFMNMMPGRLLTEKQTGLVGELESDRKALKVLDRFFPGGYERLLTAAREQNARRKLAESYVEMAHTRIDAPFVELPFLYRETMDRDGLARLARAITEQVA